MNPTLNLPKAPPLMAQHSSQLGTWPTPAVPHRRSAHSCKDGREPSYELCARIEPEHVAWRKRKRAQAEAAHAERQRRLWSRMQIVAVA